MKPERVRVLLIEDDQAHVRLIERAFAECEDEFEITVAPTLEAARNVLDDFVPDVAILDWLLPDGKGSDFLAYVKPQSSFPVLVMTSHGSEEVAVEAMKAGVIDYVVKQPATLREMPRLVARALREWGHIVERKRAEQELGRYRDHLEELVENRTRELLESREQLRQAERLASIGTLAAGIAHEINNPIGAILAAAQLALHSEEDEKDSWRSTLQEIEQQAVRCGRIVKSVLEFSRDQPTERWACDLVEIVRWVQDAARAYAARFQTSIRLELADEPLMVMMNPMEIEQVVLNLVRNAIESDPDDGLVKIRCWREKRTACVEVCDRGCGMAPADLRRVFDPFFTTRLNHGGTGLGLSVAHGIVTRHGGTLVVDSTLGSGTTMRLALPLSRPRPPDAEPVPWDGDSRR